MLRNWDTLNTSKCRQTPKRLDRFDLGILRFLLASNGAPPGTPVLRRSFRSMARELKIDQGTVRSRFKRFQEQHVLRGWYLGVSPGVTGEGVIHAWSLVEQDSDKDEVIRSLLSQRQVERVCNYFGPRLSLVVIHKNTTDPGLSMQRLAESTALGGALRKQVAVNVPVLELKATDAAIIDALRQDPWKPYSGVARELKLSTKTVGRRVSKLSAAGTIYMLPIIDLKAIHGFIPMDLVVDYSSRESKAAVNRLVLSRIGESLVFSNTSGHHGYFALAVPNISHVEQIAEWAREQEGVREVHANALQDVILNRRHYEKWPGAEKSKSEEILA